MKIAIIKDGYMESIQEAQIDEISTKSNGVITYFKYANSIEIDDFQEEIFKNLKKNECLNEKFEIKPDYSKETLYDIFTKTILPLEKGLEIPKNRTLEKFLYEDDIWVNGKWVRSEAKNKESQIQTINKKYNDKLESGVSFLGSFQDDLSNTILNPKFQYDETSQNRLLKLKDIPEVFYWRSLNNENILLSVEQKNLLYKTILLEWATDFNNRIKEIKGLK